MSNEKMKAQIGPVYIGSFYRESATFEVDNGEILTRKTEGYASALGVHIGGFKAFQKFGVTAWRSGELQF